MARQKDNSTLVRFIVYTQRIIALILLGIFIYKIESSFQGDQNRKQYDNDKALQVLFIGNSHVFHHNLDDLLVDIAATQEEQYYHIFTGKVVKGGESLKGHWQSDLAIAAIHSKKWHYVILQEQSSTPIFNSKEFHHYASLFIKEIRKTNAIPILYGTWPQTPAGVDSMKQSILKNPKNRNMSAQQRHSINQAFTQKNHATIINNAYSKAAKKNNVSVLLNAPIRASAPADINLYDDTNHNSLAGAYLTALSFYKHIFSNKKFDKNTAIPSGLGQNTAQQLIKHVENYTF